MPSAISSTFAPHAMATTLLWPSLPLICALVSDVYIVMRIGYASFRLLPLSEGIHSF